MSNETKIVPCILCTAFFFFFFLVMHDTEFPDAISIKNLPFLLSVDHQNLVDMLVILVDMLNCPFILKTHKMVKRNYDPAHYGVTQLCSWLCKVRY